MYKYVKLIFNFNRSCGEVVCKTCSEHLLPLEDATTGKNFKIKFMTFQNNI